jgi:hypothetical protein
MIKNYKILFLFFNTFIFYGQVGIGTVSPDPSAMLEIKDDNQGVLLPKITAAQKNAIVSPATGLIIYQTDGSAGFWYYNGSAWVAINSAGWKLTGDSGTSSGNFLGTTDNKDLVIATSDAERIRVSSSQNVGINQSSPTTKLHITGTAPVMRIEDGNQINKRVLTSDASGFATWTTKTITGFVPDYDWVLGDGTLTGMAFNNHICHNGKVVIGRTVTPATPATHDFEVSNGQTTGTTFGIGDTELITDGNNQTLFKGSLLPISDNTRYLGNTISNRGISQIYNTVYSVNGTIQTSDENLKSDIKPLNYGIKEIMQLKPVSYFWKEEKINTVLVPENEKQLKLGLIAQEVEKIIPEVVYSESWMQKSEDEPGEFVKRKAEILGMNYEELLPLLVKAKQQQNEEINALKKETEELKLRLNKLLEK